MSLSDGIVDSAGASVMSPDNTDGVNVGKISLFSMGAVEPSSSEATAIGAAIGVIVMSSSNAAESIGAGVMSLIGASDDIIGEGESFASNQSPASHAVIPTQQNSFSPAHT